MKKILLLVGVLVLVGAGCADRIVENTYNKIDSLENESENADDANIVLDSPENEGLTASPMVIKGKARVFEGVLNWRITSLEGKELSSGFTTTSASDVGEFGNFEERIFLPLISQHTFYLEVYSISARDGSEEGKVRVEVVPEDAGKTTVNVFFSDPEFIEEGDCSQVDFEKRTMNKTVNTAELAIQELLKGPESNWANTSIPAFTILNSISISEGLARVDFGGSTPSPWNGGSCHVTSLRSQIEETLLQFPSISSVEITLDGSSDILEP